jgi:prevent-host-death family protein
MTVNATEFKAKCLEIIDKVHRTGEPVIITKRGKVVAKLVAESAADRPWMALRGTGSVWKGDPFEPVVDEKDIEALK